MSLPEAYIIAARRTAIGRVGGIHKTRRVEDLAAPVFAEALKDARVSPAKVEGLILGNTTAGNNPARLVALTSGLAESVPAMTVDRQCASGLEAILTAIRLIRLGEADILLAGGAESLSMAPWRIAKPRHVHMMPRFIDPVGGQAGRGDGDSDAAQIGDELARNLRISRHQQDDYALRSHMKASLARDARRFVKEIVALKLSAEEARDQSAVEPEMQELQDLQPFNAKGSLTSANTSSPHDGAAAMVVVSEKAWQELGKPPALRLRASASVGLNSSEAGEAAILALRRALSRLPGTDAAALDIVEMSEVSAVEAIALRNALGLADDVLNPDGGAIARGHPMGAAGAVLVVRLFTRMVRQPGKSAPKTGAAVLSALGAQGTAAIFEAT